VPGYLVGAGDSLLAGHEQADVGDAVLVHVPGDGPSGDAGKAERHAGEDVRTISQRVEVEEEGLQIGAVGGQVDGAVAVEVADDGEAAQAVVNDKRIGAEVVGAVEIDVPVALAVEDGDLVLLAEGRVEM